MSNFTGSTRRKAIRQAVAEKIKALIGLSPGCSNSTDTLRDCGALPEASSIYDYRVDTLPDGRLPAVLIYTFGEEVENGTSSRTDWHKLNVNVIVSAIGKDGSSAHLGAFSGLNKSGETGSKPAELSIDDIIDHLQQMVKDALLNKHEALGGLVQEIAYKGYKTETKDGEKGIILVANMLFLATFMEVKPGLNVNS